MTSSTLMASRSKRFASIARCLPRIYWPSSTSERSSSCVSGVWLSPSDRILSNLSKPCTKRLTNHTTGVAILSIGASRKLTRGASRSACAAPITFGVISEKTSKANEIATVPSASAASPSPKRRLVITAVSVAVAAIEKNPEARSSAASAAKRLLRGISSKPVEPLRQLSSIWLRAGRVKKSAQRLGSLAAENHLEHEFAADVGDYQQTRPGEDPVQRGAAAPAVAMPTE